MNDILASVKHPGVDETGRFETIAEMYKGGWSWDIAAVWRDKATGKLYGATDSGCSCYGPWDDQSATLSECVQITHVREAAELLNYVTNSEGGEITTTERQDFARAVEVALASV